MNSRRQDQVVGCLLGQCLGDALGFIVEGQPPHYCRQYVEEILKTGRFEGIGRGPYALGQYSDDSQLARELLQSFAACRRFEPADYARRIAAIFKENRVVGRGRATEEAAARLIMGVPWNIAGTPPPAAGNGSAMRAAPIGLLFYDHPVEMVRAAHDQGRITHQDKRCSAGAVAIAGAVAMMIREPLLEITEFTRQLSEWTLPYDPIMAEALNQLPSWIELPSDQAVAHISKVGLAAGYSDNWQGISPFVTGSVLWSLYSFLKTPDDYWESICTAIAAGGDVDTTAAMTGAIGGARMGRAGLPESLLPLINDNRTWKCDELTDLAVNCYKIKLEAKNKVERTGE